MAAVFSGFESDGLQYVDILEAMVGVKRHLSLESLKESLRQQCEPLSPDDLRPIAEKFAKRLALCIRSKGGHFETT
ncbi:unnamed protein product [Heligmosomoides polygyrus]|uniref:1-phosphatidylinositol 4-kinase n=1 Tax=Heligmosomoides polygyrus TaxID=6339 RepID=A0A183FDK6_HELPZ|nr:unnamed protein product [Heligmosomoides polygyrus]